MARQKTETGASDCKPSLAVTLSARLKEREGELKAAAQKLQLSYATLRQDLSQNRFFEEDLIKLCKAAGLPTARTELETQYTFTLKAGERGARRIERGLREKSVVGTATLGDVFSLLDEKMDRVRHFVVSAKEIIPKFFHCLGGKDTLVIFITDELPTHWDRAEAFDWIQPFAKSLRNGAQVVYLYPSNNLVQQITENGYSGMFTGEQVKEGFETFKRDLTAVAADGKKLSERICLAKHECPIVCTPQHRYVLYFHPRNGKTDVWATGTFPIRQRHGLGETSADYLVVALNRTFTSILHNACVRALQKLVEEEKKSGSQTNTEKFLRSVLPH